jgi:hypothetical protein
MAKRPNEQVVQRQAKVRYFEIEASDETIQKALDTIERMRKPVEVMLAPTRRLTTTRTTPAEATLFDEQEPIDVDSTVVENETQSTETQTQRRKRSETGNVDRNAGIVANGDVDFYPNGSQPLKEFVAEKQPKTDKDKCLVFCVYLQETLKLVPYGAGHIMAAFNEIDHEIPADLPATLRNMRVGKKGSKGFLDITDLENIRVTTNGLNRVRHQLGKANAREHEGAK